MDCNTTQLHFCGPGDYDLQKALPLWLRLLCARAGTLRPLGAALLRVRQEEVRDLRRFHTVVGHRVAANDVQQGGAAAASALPEVAAQHAVGVAAARHLRLTVRVRRGFP